MRHLFTVLVAGFVAVALNAGYAAADSVEVKGPHICCKQCVNVVGKILEGVEGVSDAKCDVKNKTITFTAKDEKAAKAGVAAIFKGGFSGKATSDGKALKVELAEVAKGDKAEAVTVKDVHVCCGMCVTAVKNAFKDSKVTIEGTGAQRTVIVTGGDIYRGTVLETLRKAGFNGNVDK